MDHIVIPFFSDSEKKIHQSWGGDDGNAEFKTEEAATFDAAAEVNNDWNTSAPNEWNAPADTASTEWAGTTSTSVNDWGPSADSNADADADPWGSGSAPPVEGEGKVEQGRGRKDKEAEEEDNTLTLDQYLAQQKEKESAVPKLEGIRKANEGADDVWKGAVPLSKNEDEVSYYVGKACTFNSRYSCRISQSCRQKVPQRLVPRRKKRSTSRSRLVSIVQSVVAVVDVATVVTVDEVIVVTVDGVIVVTVVTVVIVDGVTVSEDTVGVVVVAEILDARIPMDLLLPSMSTTKPPSLLWPEQ